MVDDTKKSKHREVIVHDKAEAGGLIVREERARAYVDRLQDPKGLLVQHAGRILV